jgi:hypothetical protein
MSKHIAVERYIGLILGSDATLQALRGTRIWPIRRPQGSDVPAQTFHFVSSPEDTHYEDLVFAMARPTYLINAWGPDVLVLEQIVDRTYQLLHRSGGSNVSGEIIVAKRVREHGPFGPLEVGDTLNQLGAYYQFDVD